MGLRVSGDTLGVGLREYVAEPPGPAGVRTPLDVAAADSHAGGILFVLSDESSALFTVLIHRLLHARIGGARVDQEFTYSIRADRCVVAPDDRPRELLQHETSRLAVSRGGRARIKSRAGGRAGWSCELREQLQLDALLLLASGSERCDRTAAKRANPGRGRSDWRDYPARRHAGGRHCALPGAVSAAGRPLPESRSPLAIVAIVRKDCESRA